MYDDQRTYFSGLLDFLRGSDAKASTMATNVGVVKNHLACDARAPSV